ncbi:flavodoxin family protein [Aminipila butyrica]|uniref:Flavodoxin family protein n=1 Tax=Aminipila butyrica TaxID=433296 RepID=A0A858BUR5_9FIRM|nr:flavodoxin family protein [Aminipila butyrica]QIB68815.1 flavodoxin family protein [Aminipila butyrica]
MLKVLLVSGSPRAEGNTKTALNQVLKGIQVKEPQAEVALLDLGKMKLSGCTNCDACKENGENCVIPDEGALLTDKLEEADVVIIGTPVYYWGMTAQLKTAIDRLYAKEEQLRQQKKKLGFLAIGAASVEDVQYKMIADQFKCIGDYFGWSLVFNKAISAFETGDLAKNSAQLQELEALGQAV